MKATTLPCRGRLILAVLLGGAGAIPSPISAATTVPAPSSSRAVLLRGADVYPMTGPMQPRSSVLMVRGRIAAVGPDVAAPAGAEVIDVSGRRIYPGLISANTKLGLREIASIDATIDVAETGQINPNAQARVAVNPDNSHLAVTRMNGVLTALVTPLNRADGTRAPALIAGQSALMRLEGWTWEEMTIRASVGLHVYWPEQTINRRPQAAKSPEDQQKEIERKRKVIRDAFAMARAYLLAKEAGAPRAVDLRWEAMLPYIKGERPVLVHANELKQIESVLTWAQSEPGVRLILVGGLDAGLVAPRLKQLNVPVLLSGTHELPLRRDDPHDAAFTVAAQLHAAGVRFCLAPDDAKTNGQDRNLPYEAAKAVAHGLPADEALRAITLYPAQILGVGDELGSIEVGKRATLIVTDGDPLEIPTEVKMAFVDGAPIALQSRQTELRDKYRTRLQRVDAARGAGPR